MCALGGSRRNNCKTAIDQMKTPTAPETLSTGPGRIGLKGPLAQNLPQAPILLPRFQGAPVKLALAK